MIIKTKTQVDRMIDTLSDIHRAVSQAEGRQVTPNMVSDILQGITAVVVALDGDNAYNRYAGNLLDYYAG